MGSVADGKDDLLSDFLYESSSSTSPPLGSYSVGVGVRIHLEARRTTISINKQTTSHVVPPFHCYLLDLELNKQWQHAYISESGV